MKIKMSNMLCVLLALSFAITLFAGCTGQTAKNQDTTGEQTAAATAAVTEDPLKPITITAFSTVDTPGIPKWGEDPVSKSIIEKTGVTLEIEYLVGDANEKIGLMLAAGDYPGMLLTVNNEHIARFAEAGALVAMDEYIDKGLFPSVEKVFGDKLGAMRSESDGKIYGFSSKFGDMPTDAPVNMQIQYAVLKEAGYPKINTLDEMLDLMKSYKAKHPEYDGKSTMGLLSSGSGWTFNIGFNNAALRTAGFQDDGNFYIDPETKKATYGIMTPEAKTYFKWLNKVNREGLFEQDSFSLDMNGSIEKIATGRVMAVSMPTWFTGGAESSLREQKKFDRCYAKLPLFVSKEAAEKSRTHYFDANGDWKNVITKNCEDIERTVKFLDAMWSEEMQILCNWGIEGVNYTVDSEGKKYMKPEDIKAYLQDKSYKNRTGVQLYLYWTWGNFFRDSDGQLINPFRDPQNEADAYSEVDKEVLAAYKPDALTWIDLFPKAAPSEWGFAWKMTLPSDTEGALAEKRIENEIRGKAVFDMVNAASDEAFENEWNKFVQQCKDAGIEKREAEINTALEQRMNLWYGK